MAGSGLSVAGGVCVRGPRGAELKDRTKGTGTASSSTTTARAFCSVFCVSFVRSFVLSFVTLHNRIGNTNTLNVAVAIAIVQDARSEPHG